MTSATRFRRKYLRFAVIFPLSIPLSLLLSFLVYNISFMGKIYPNVYVSGVDVGGDNMSEASLKLSQNISMPEKIKLKSQKEDIQVELSTKDLEAKHNHKASAERAFNLTRTGNFVLDSSSKIKLLFVKKEIGMDTAINDQILSRQVSKLSDQITSDPVYPSIEKVDGEIKVNNGTPGIIINTDLLKAMIGESLSFSKSDELEIPLTSIDPQLNENEIKNAKDLAKKYLGKSLVLTFETNRFIYNDVKIFKLLNPKGGYNQNDIKEIVYQVASEINRPPQNPKFEFGGNKVSEFLPALDGITIEGLQLENLISESLSKLPDTKDSALSFEIPVIRKSPDISTDKVNNFGIKELIGRGESTYYHSIPGRVFNVNLASSRINGTLVKPGETFSFNQVLGDVSKLTGYKEAYVIENGRTVLGDGGGVCQVSSTLFRAVLNAGLPVIERIAHAYRVGYYEQGSPPGFDATVYAPSPDFKFKNDTQSYVLIQAKNNPKKYSLIFELYGTKDGRTATVSKPSITNQIPPPPDMYQDDPTLPAGQTKQVDYAAWGAKVIFSYKVTKGNEVLIDKKFVSSYQPWQAIYLKGTGPAN